MLLIGSWLLAALATILLVAALRRRAPSLKHSAMIALTIMAGFNLAVIFAYLHFDRRWEQCTELCAGLMLAAVFRHWLVMMTGSVAASFVCSLHFAGHHK